MIKKTTIIISLILALLQAPVLACFCGSHVSGFNNTTGSILTISAATLAQGKFNLAYALNYQDLDAFSNNIRRLNNRRGRSAESADSLMTQVLSASVGLTDDLTLIANFPFRALNNSQSTFAGFTLDEGDSVGIGDFSFLAKYRVLKKKRSSLALIAGLKIPSGDDNQKNEIGDLLGADTQPGSGSFDPILGFAFSRAFDKFNFDSSLLYQLTTKNDRNEIVGDSINFNIAISKELPYRKTILGQELAFDAALELNGLWREKLEVDGVKDPNHGGLIISITPGLRIKINELIYNSIYFSLPVIQDLNGNQSDLNYQIGFNTSINF